MKSTALAGVTAILLVLKVGADDEWPTYGGDAGGTRYAPLHDVTRATVANLRMTWSYHTRALEPESALNQKAAFEATPILVGGTLYLSTPFNQIVALDPATGAERWTCDPHVDRAQDYSEVSSRGVAAWTDAQAIAAVPCALRIFEGTIDGRLIGVDGKTGRPSAGLGTGGAVDLKRGVGYGPEFSGNYQVTSAPTIVGDVVITGSSIGDNGARLLRRRPVW
jgi:quinoprotein glucose dehydrogenase